MTEDLAEFETAMRAVDSYLQQAGLSSGQREVLNLAKDQFTSKERARLSVLERERRFAFAPWLHFPMFGALLGDEPLSRDLIVASALIEMGIDLLDSVMDDELCEELKSIGPAIIQMNAYLLITVLPDSLLESKQLAKKQQALLKVSAGQQLDLQRRGSFCETTYFDCIKQKTGAWRALYFQISRADFHESWDGIITELGVVSQLYNDFHDIFNASWSVDLGNAIYTYPIICAYHKMSNDARCDFELELQRTKNSLESQQVIRNKLKASGVLKSSYLFVSLLVLDLKRRAARLAQTKEAATLFDKIVQWHS